MVKLLLSVELFGEEYYQAVDLGVTFATITEVLISLIGSRV